jgi:hypothetical protein
MFKGKGEQELNALRLWRGEEKRQKRILSGRQES